MYFTRFRKKQQYLRNIPRKPGVYRFYDKNKEIIYVGASSNLRKRVGQHFTNHKSNHSNNHSIRLFTKFIEYLCHETVESAFEAEKVEIWTHKPRFNKRGVITKAFSYLIIRKSPILQLICLSSSDYGKISDNDEFYRFNIHHLKLQQNLRDLRRQIPYCMPSSVCWDHHLGLCNNSCRSRNLSLEEQNITQIESLIKSISGTGGRLIEEWEMNLTKCMETLQFEAAKKFHRALESIKELRLKFCGKGVIRDTDQFFFRSISHKKYLVTIRFYRRDKVILEAFENINNHNGMNPEQFYSYFLQDFYKKSSSVPHNIQLNVHLSLSFKKMFQKWLKRYYGKDIPLDGIS